MSAWYIFNCMGFYPVCPGSNEYSIGSPCVPGLKVHLTGGGTLNMTTEGWSDEAVYVKAVYLNGKRLSEPVLTYDDIKDGADLHFVMSRKPSKSAFSSKI
jgi:putative alpha-1,2-mannosidase